MEAVVTNQGWARMRGCAELVEGFMIWSCIWASQILFPLPVFTTRDDKIMYCCVFLRETCAMLYPNFRDCLLSMEGEDVFEDGRGCAKLREIVELKSTARSLDKGIKEKRGHGDVWEERQQDSGRGQICVREKREQSAVSMCQESGVVTQQLSSR